MPGTISNGDVVLVSARGQGLVSASIELGERRRYGFGSPYARYSHCALVYDDTHQEPEAMLIVEATGRSGVHKAFLSKYGRVTCKIISTQVDEHDWKQMKAFLDSVLHAREGYDWLAYAGLTLYALTGTRLCLQTAGTAICSGLACDALTRAGFIWSRPPYACTPADIDADLERARCKSWELDPHATTSPARMRSAGT